MNNIDDLRTHLFDAINGVKDGALDIEKAKMISELAQTIINTAKVEVEHAKVVGGNGTSFLQKKLPFGITGVTVHRMK